MQVTTAEQSAQRDAAAIAAGTESFVLMLQAGTQAAAVIMRVAGAQLARGVDVFTGSGNNGGDGYIVAAQLVRLGVNVRVIEAKAPSTPDAQRAAQLAKAWGCDVLPWQTLLQQHNDADMQPTQAATGRAVVVDTLPANATRGVVVDALPATATRGVVVDALLGTGARGVVVDALLGTGARGALRDETASAAQHVHAAQQRGALVVALDMPTGVNATTGECAPGHVTANATIMFGTMRIGALSARHACGDITVVDIGLGVHASLSDNAPQLASAEALRSVLPAIAWDAHKGTRGRTLVVGGNTGMAGAVQLACSGALASGAGLVRASVAPHSVAAVQGLNPAVVCSAWPHVLHTRNTGAELAFDEALDEPLQGLAAVAEAPKRIRAHEHIGTPGSLQHDVRDWAHAVVVGPGLGRDQHAASLLQYLLECAAHSDAALVLDADALTVLARYDMVSLLQRRALERDVVITPHLGEFGTLAAALNITAPDSSTVDRLRAARAMARATHCTVLLKGTPNICASATGDTWLIPRGSHTLATGGTGDVLSGVIAALLASERAGASGAGASGAGANNHDASSGGEYSATGRGHYAPQTAALVAAAAWVHGVAGEMLKARGHTVADVVRALPAAWSAFSHASPLPPGVLAELPSALAHDVSG